jgi:hypothetical protein
MRVPSVATLPQNEAVTLHSAGIVADDLTGAGDSAVQFASLGWRTRLTLGEPVGITATPGSVVAVVTDSRSLPTDAARIRTTDAVMALMGAGIDRLFVKIDSTMRGSVDSQVRGALDAWTHRHPDSIAVVCPAYPGMGRTVEGGLLLVDGAGVETTSVGRDPVTPVTTSALADLLPGAVAIQLAQGGASQLALVIAAAEARVVTVDASTDADLALVAAAVEMLGARASRPRWRRSGEGGRWRQAAGRRHRRGLPPVRPWSSSARCTMSHAPSTRTCSKPQPACSPSPRDSRKYSAPTATLE